MWSAIICTVALSSNRSIAQDIHAALMESNVRTILAKLAKSITIFEVQQEYDYKPTNFGLAKDGLKYTLRCRELQLSLKSDRKELDRAWGLLSKEYRQSVAAFDTKGSVSFGRSRHLPFPAWDFSFKIASNCQGSVLIHKEKKGWKIIGLGTGSH